MRKKIGECLIQAGLITEEDLKVALAEHKRTGERVGVVLVRMNLATEKQIAKALAFQLGFPYINLTENPPDPTAVVLIPKEVATPFDAVLGTILFSPDRKLAIIDNRIVGVGDEVRGARITDITAGAVLLRDAQGRLRRLTLGAGGR